MKKKHKSNSQMYTNRFNRLSNSTKKINKLSCRRGGIKL